MVKVCSAPVAFSLPPTLSQSGGVVTLVGTVGLQGGLRPAKTMDGGWEGAELGLELGVFLGGAGRGLDT